MIEINTELLLLEVWKSFEKTIEGRISKLFNILKAFLILSFACWGILSIFALI